MTTTDCPRPCCELIYSYKLADHSIEPLKIGRCGVCVFAVLFYFFLLHPILTLCCGACFWIAWTKHAQIQLNAMEWAAFVAISPSTLIWIESKTCKTATNFYTIHHTYKRQHKHTWPFKHKEKRNRTVVVVDFFLFVHQWTFPKHVKWILDGYLANLWRNK